MITPLHRCEICLENVILLLEKYLKETIIVLCDGCLSYFVRAYFFFRVIFFLFSGGMQVALKRKTVIHRVGPCLNRNVKHIAFREPVKLSSRVLCPREDKICCYDTCIFALRFFSWERRHRGGSLRDFVLEFRSHRLKNNSDSLEFWNNFQPSERQLRIRKRRYSIVPYTGEPTPLQVVFPSE